MAKAKAAQLKASRKKVHSPIALSVPDELAGAVIDQEELRDERRAAEEVNVAERDRADDAVLGEPCGRQRHREQRAEDDRDGDELRA